jgi:hypothetical protein
MKLLMLPGVELLSTKSGHPQTTADWRYEAIVQMLGSMPRAGYRNRRPASRKFPRLL